MSRAKRKKKKKDKDPKPNVLVELNEVRQSTDILTTRNTLEYLLTIVAKSFKIKPKKVRVLLFSHFLGYLLAFSEYDLSRAYSREGDEGRFRARSRLYERVVGD